MFYEGFVRLGKGLPILQSTHLGWIVMGNIPSHYSHCSNQDNRNITSNNAQIVPDNLELDNLLTRFWSTEDFPRSKILSLGDQLPEEIFSSSVKRLPNGPFQIDWQCY